MSSRECSVDGCTGPHIARGWCKIHYANWRRHGDPLHTYLCTESGCQQQRPMGLRGGKPWTCDEHRGCIACGKKERLASNSPPLCSTHYDYVKRRGSLDAPRRHRPHVSADATTIRCRDCALDLPIDSFRIGGWGGRLPRCRPCDREYMRNLYAQDADRRRKIKEATSRWAAANPSKTRASIKRRNFRRRARVAGTQIYSVTEKDQRRIENSACCACGATVRVEVDHVIPVARGGSYSVGNLRPLCRPCNASKSDLTWTEWRYSRRPRAVLVFTGGNARD
jgi:hypothetical protein